MLCIYRPIGLPQRPSMIRCGTSDVVRDRAKRTLDKTQLVTCLHAVVASSLELRTDAYLPTGWIEEWTKSVLGQKRNCAVARSREKGVFPTGDETAHRKSETAPSQILCELIS
jgi:hypothetical protein